MTATPVEAGLFASLDPPRLAGSRCRDCGTVAFPAQAGCAKCTGTDVATVELADRGTLWTWTVQGFEPKPPYAADGHLELYKSTMFYDGAVGREQHGFPSQQELPL